MQLFVLFNNFFLGYETNLLLFPASLLSSDEIGYFEDMLLGLVDGFLERLLFLGEKSLSPQPLKLKRKDIDYL